MKLDDELALASRDRDSRLSIGVFDGVHLGHRHLLKRLIAEATSAGHLAGVVTFRNHPASVLRPDFQPHYLSSVEERVRLIGDSGVDFVAPVTFDEEVSKLSAKDFVVRLQRTFRMRGLVVGPDFGLGHKRQGDVKALTALGAALGFDVKVVESLEDSGGPVKSTAVREALAHGEIVHAARLLGRNYTLTGVVVGGDKLGRTLGFPTANLEATPGMAVPCDGIYAAWALLREKRFMAATSIGTRPTFGDNVRVIEALLLDFQGDVYGQNLRLEFVQRLRDQVKFDAVEELLEQIDRDVEQTRGVLQELALGPVRQHTRPPGKPAVSDGGA